MKTCFSAFTIWLASLLIRNDSAEMDLIRRSMPALCRDKNQNSELLRVRTGLRLARRIRRAVKNHENILLLSDPGVGKTYTILQELEALERCGKIRGHLHFTATKSITWSDWFDNRLTIKKGPDGKSQMVLIPAPIMAAFPDADESGEVIVFVDEITRMNEQMRDGFLEVLEQGTILIEGVKIKLPVRFIFAGNMPGSDTCTPLSPAFRSRLHEIVILFSADTDVMSRIYLPKRFQDHAKACGLTMRMPAIKTFRLMAVTWLILNGWPIERPCYTETPENLLRLVKELAAADAELKADLEAVSRLTYRGPDARKLLEWLEQAMGIAAERGPDAQITVADLIQCAAVVMRGGYRHKLNEDRQRKELLELDQATYRVVRKMFTSQQLAGIVADSDGPCAVACNISEACGALVEEMAETLWLYNCKLEGRDPKEAPGHFRKLARLVAGLEEGGDFAEQARAGGWLRPDGRFTCLADQQLCLAIGRLAGDTVIGRIFAAMAERDVTPNELLRDLLQGSEKAWEFAPEFAAALRRRPELLPRLGEAIALVDALLSGEQREADALFADLLQRVARRAVPQHAQRLRQVARTRSVPRAKVEHGRPALRGSLVRFLIGPFVLVTGLLIAAAPNPDVPTRSMTMTMNWTWPDNPFVYVIIACGLAAVYLALERSLALRRGLYLPNRLVGLLEGLRSKKLAKPEALELEARQQESHLSDAVLEVLTVAKSSSRGLSRVANTVTEQIAARAERNTDALATLVQLAPLVGLAGSLYAMIRAVGSAGQVFDVKVLAAGFFASLTTSLLGIAVAGPSLVLHAYFDRKGRSLRDEMRTLLEILARSLRRRRGSGPDRGTLIK